MAVKREGDIPTLDKEANLLRLWDLETGSLAKTLVGHSEEVWGVAVTADGIRAASASRDKTLKVWDLATGDLFATFQCDAPVFSCAFADQRTIIAGDGLGRVRFFRIED